MDRRRYKLLIEEYGKHYLETFLQERPREWEYKNICTLLGAKALYETTRDPFYLEAVRQYMDDCLERDGNIRGYCFSDFNLDQVLGGRLLLFLSGHEKEGAGKGKYDPALKQLAGQVESQPRTKTGNFWHKGIYPNQVWLDGLYMCLPFWAEYAHDADVYEDIVSQLANVRKYLYDEKKGLHYHGWDCEKQVFWADRETGLSPNFWLRAIGWHLMALADVYEVIAKDGELQYSRFLDTIKSLWRETIDGVLRYQDQKTGFFWQLVDKNKENGNYLETSGSLMVCYSILKGIRLGVLDHSYRPYGEKVLETVEMRFADQRRNGEPISLTGTCKGAGLGPAGNLRRDGSAAYYLSEPVVADEKKAAGALLMAYGQQMQLRGECDG